MFPQDETGFSIDDQFYVGNSGLLVKPVTRPGVTEESIYLPEDNVCLFHIGAISTFLLTPWHKRFTMTILRIGLTGDPRRERM